MKTKTTIKNCIKDNHKDHQKSNHQENRQDSHKVDHTYNHGEDYKEIYIGKYCFVLASIQHFNGFMDFHMQYLNAVYLCNEGNVSFKFILVMHTIYLERIHRKANATLQSRYTSYKISVLIFSTFPVVGSIVREVI